MRPDKKSAVILAALVSFLGAGPVHSAPFTYERTLLRPSPASQTEFGRAVAIVGAHIAVGAHTDGLDGPNAGTVYLYDAATGVFERVLHNPDPVGGLFFGESLAAVGPNRVLVSSRNDDTAGVNAGAAFLFDVQTGAIVRSFINPVAPNPNGSSPAPGFGEKVVARNGVITISHRGASGGGAAYLYDSATGQSTATLHNPNGSGASFFGHAIALAKDRVAVSELDTLTIHMFTLDGAFQFSIPRPLPTASSDRFGFSLAIGQQHLLIGDDRQLANEPSGAAYLFSPDTGAYGRTLTAPVPSAGDNFGVTVALSGNTAAIASFAGSGVVHFYDLATGSLLQSVPSPEPQTDDFGRSVAMANGRLVVGSASFGAAFVYTTPCGNGTLEDGEQCDDGNTEEGDCCSPQCTFESIACDDGNLCTQNDSCQAGTCMGATISCDDSNPCTDDRCQPESGCAWTNNTAQCDDGNLCTIGDACSAGSCASGTPLKCEPFAACDPTSGCQVIEQLGCAQPTVPRQVPLAISQGRSDRQDALSWTWKGAAIAAGDFGDPTKTTSYRFFVFDDSAASQPVLDLAIPAGGMCGDRRPKPCWKVTRTGFKYARRDATGTLRLGLRTGAAGKAGIQIQAQGPLLQLPAIPLVRAVRAQLSQTGSLACWGALYDLYVSKNDSVKFRARAN